MGDRRTRTTSELLDAAEAELIERGYAALTMEAVSRRAFFSIGAVYERWESRDALLVALATEHLPDLVERIDGPHADLACRLVIAELLLASTEFPEVRAPALEALHAYLYLVELPKLTDPVGWWSASTLLGEALLACGGAELPDMASIVRRTLAAMERLPVDLPPPPRFAVAAPDPFGQRAVPASPTVSPSDVTAGTLRDAAEQVIVSAGLSEADTRAIAAVAGVTTGALYRRYRSKSDLLAQVLAARMQPDRYAWSVNLVAAVAQIGDDPLPVGSYAGRLMGERLWATVSDIKERRVLLALTSAARSNDVVRDQVVGQILAVHASRLDLLAALVDSGLLSTRVDVHAAAWLLQAPPVGARLLAECGELPAESNVVDCITRTTIVTLFPDWSEGTTG
jgi:AcrR family transcriptional regulator